MRKGWEIWALRRLQDRERCLMEPGMSCIPLRGDTICLQCYDDDTARRALEEMNEPKRINTNIHKEGS